MKTSLTQSKIFRTALILLVVGIVFGSAYSIWLPPIQGWFAARNTSAHGHTSHDHGHSGHSHDPSGDDHGAGEGHGTHGYETNGHSHDAHGQSGSAKAHRHGSGSDHGHDHSAHDPGRDGAAHADAHEGHDDANALELSDIARKNIGLKTDIVRTQDFVRTVSVPAMVVERPGRSQVEITAPLTGMVQRVYPIEGEAMQPGQPLFDLRLTHEDLVTAQRNFLQSAQELDVVQREIARLESLEKGLIAGRRVLEHEYEKEKIEAALHAQRQGLLLHGLSETQIDDIMTSRKLIPVLTVVAPPFDNDADHHDIQHLYHVQSILVKRGQSVAAGHGLAVLADHCLLYVEGHAFEDDAERLIQAAREEWLVNVAPVATEHARDEAVQLQVLYVADHVERDTRSLPFYLSLPNDLVRDESDHGHRFVAWKFRPGQRMEVKLPLGKPWTDQIVLPAEAVVSEGADAFVFQQDGDHFDRISVHVIYNDKDTVVVERDKQLVGATLAMSGAYQMHLALKNKAGGGVDPYAGHTH